MTNVAVRPPRLPDLHLKNHPSSVLPGRITLVADAGKGVKSIMGTREPTTGKGDA